MTYVKVNGAEYAATIDGNMSDYTWDNRESKSITTSELTSAEAITLFHDDVTWSIVERTAAQIDETVEETVSEWDNSDFSIAGDVTDHRDGRITIKMGKPTDLELAYEELYG